MTRPARLIVVVVALSAALAYLRDPPWLIGDGLGLPPLETMADGTRIRWTGGHASFFVPSNADRDYLAHAQAVRFTACPPRNRYARDRRPDHRTACPDDESWHEMTVGDPARPSPPAPE